MIIQCQNCLKQFTVRDEDIPVNGRIVQCGNCSTQWLQMPLNAPIAQATSTTTKKIPKTVDPQENEEEVEVNKSTAKIEFKASDKKTYKFLGSQWAEVLDDGRYGKLARKNITKELNRLAGRKPPKKIKKIKKTDPYEEKYQEIEKKGMGLFSFLIVFIMFFAAIILGLDTFKSQLIPIFPDLENYLVYIFETINNIYIIIKDLFNKYK